MSNYKTDISRVRSVAKALLHIDIVETDMPFVASHPFTNSWITAVQNDKKEMGMIDLHNAENLVRWRATIEHLIDESNAEEIMLLINHPYQLVFLKLVRTFISDNDMGKCIRIAWTQIECISLDVNVSGREIVGLFKRANKSKLMDREERYIYENLPEQVTLWRGVTSYNKSMKKALSWTQNIEIANFFATRFSQEGEVWKVTVPKSRVLACFNGRDESEIVVDLYGKAFDYEKIKVKGREG